MDWAAPLSTLIGGAASGEYRGDNEDSTIEL